MFDDDKNERTKFEAKPFGARQRILPRRGFKAAKTGIVLPGLPEVVVPKPKVKSWRERAATDEKTIDIAASRAKTVDELWPPVASRAKFLPVTPKTHILDLADLQEVAPAPIAPPRAATRDDLPTDPIGATALPPTLSIPSLAAFTGRPTPVPASPALARANLPQLVRIATTWPTRHVVLRDLVWRYRYYVSGALAGVLVAIVAIAFLESDHKAAPVAAIAFHKPAVKTMTVTPIEPTVPAFEPTVPEPTVDTAPKPRATKSAKPTSKARRRHVVVDASTPLGQLRPAKVR